MRILGISLGTRDVGMAILHHKDLIDWRTSSFRGEWSYQKLRLILIHIDRHIIRHQIEYVAIKIPPQTHQTPQFLQLLKQLTSLLKARGCIVVSQTKADIKRAVPEVYNSKSLMQYVVLQYPVLLTEQAQELKNRLPYHIKMFEAVLAAYICT